MNVYPALSSDRNSAIHAVSVTSDATYVATRTLPSGRSALPAGAFSKRGEPRSAASYVKQACGGCKAWVEALPADAFRIAGDWDRADVTLALAAAAPPPPPEPGAPLVAGTTRTGRCAFWDLRNGWGKVAVDGAAGARVFVHWRDLRDRSSLPRGGRVRFAVAESDKGFAGVDVVLLETTAADVDALLAAGCLAPRGLAAMAIDDLGDDGARGASAAGAADDDGDDDAEMTATTPDASFVFAPPTFDHVAADAAVVVPEDDSGVVPVEPGEDVTILDWPGAYGVGGSVTPVDAPDTSPKPTPQPVAPRGVPAAGRAAAAQAEGTCRRAPRVFKVPETVDARDEHGRRLAWRAAGQMEGA